MKLNIGHIIGFVILSLFVFNETINKINIVDQDLTELTDVEDESEEEKESESEEESKTEKIHNTFEIDYKTRFSAALLFSTEAELKILLRHSEILNPPPEFL